MSPGAAQLDIVHALHARRAGSCALPLARGLHVPCVITLTGTDATHDIHQDEHGAATRATIESCDALIALRASQLDELAAAGVRVPPMTVVIPQGIDLGDADADPGKPDRHEFDLRAVLGVGPREFVALLPGGLRPVKGQHVALAALEALQWAGAPFHLALAGPTLDAEYVDALRARAAGSPYVHFLGALPHAHMGAALRAADLTLNCSESEGESNAILEAQWAGRPVLARRNQGNSALIEHCVTGLLFDTPDELAAAITRVRCDPAELAALGARARAHVEDRADPALEAARHARLYASLVAGPRAV